MRKPPKILFLSTGNATRSQMAEGYLRSLAGETLVTSSTGLSSGRRNPLAVEVMKEVGVDISSQTSQSVAESLKEQFAYVVAICDATKERFPIFPFALNILRWSLMDPAEADGSYQTRRDIFRRVRDDIRIKVQTFVNEKLGAATPVRIAS